MATAIQNNGGMQPLTNGTVNHVEEVNNLTTELSRTTNNELFEVRLESQESDSEKDGPLALDIYINNVVCSFSVRCHLNLREIALNGSNVEYKRENGVSFLDLRREI